MAEDTRQYIDFYAQAGKLICERSCEVMNAPRAEALQTFPALGFPTKKVERYKYTDVAEDFAPDYGIALTPLEVKNLPYCHRISEAPVDVTPYYNKLADRQDAVVALNTMLSVDALVIYVPRNTKVEHPIQISNVLKGEQDTMVNRRILIILEQCAEADIVITDKAVDQMHFLSNQVVEVFAGDGSHLNLYEVEETHLLCTRYSSVFVQQGRDSQVHHTSFTLFNGHTRNRMDVSLKGEGSEVILNGCVIADKTQHVGRILVREGAQKTISNETNANLCATSSARMYTQPMLEIYADDVKCSHGSTVGQMNDEALFYMRQRGISEQEARLLLKSAFITEVIETIPLEALRDRLHVLVDKRLRGELSKCEGCKLCK